MTKILRKILHNKKINGGKMSKLILTIILLVFVGTMSSAQMRMSPAERAKQLGETLKLNNDQIKKVSKETLARHLSKTD